MNLNILRKHRQRTFDKLGLSPDAIYAKVAKIFNRWQYRFPIFHEGIIFKPPSEFEEQGRSDGYYPPAPAFEGQFYYDLIYLCETAVDFRLYLRELELLTRQRSTPIDCFSSELECLATHLDNLRADLYQSGGQHLRMLQFCMYNALEGWMIERKIFPSDLERLNQWLEQHNRWLHEGDKELRKSLRKVLRRLNLSKDKVNTLCFHVSKLVNALNSYLDCMHQFVSIRAPRSIKEFLEHYRLLTTVEIDLLTACLESFAAYHLWCELAKRLKERESEA